MLLMALAFLVACSPAPAQAGPASLTLRDALLYAVEHSPTLQVSRLEVGVRERQRKNALARFFPSLDFTAQTGLRGQTSGGTSLLDLSYGNLGLTLTETLYDNGQNFWNYRLGNLVESRAQVEFERDRARLALDVARAYYRFSLSARLTHIRGRQVDTLQNQLKTVEAQYRQGMRTRRDYLRFKTQYQRSEIAHVTAQQELKATEVELLRLLGAPREEIELGKSEKLAFQPLREERKRPEFPEKPPRLDEHFEMRIARLSQRANDVQVGLARRRWLPNLNLRGDATVGIGSTLAGLAPGPFQANPGFQWSVGVQLTYNLWDWGILRSEWQQAELQRDQGNLGLERTLQQTASEIQNLQLDFARLQKNFDLSLELLRVEEETYEALNSEYRLGRVSFLDLITALNDVLGARISYASAYFSVLETLAQHHYHQGDLYETLTR
jgi:outer membrane protein TolC